MTQYFTGSGNETLERDAGQMDPLTDEVTSYLSFIFRHFFSTALSLLGMCTNAINMVVFYKMSLFDGVTQNFFILSISDGLYATVCSVNSIAYTVWRIVRAHAGYDGLEIAIQVVYRMSYYALAFPQNVSVMTTVMIAVVRCCCVAMPLKVRYLFTPRRQLAAIFLFSGVVLSISVFFRASLYLVHSKNPVTNITIVYVTGPFWSIETASNNIVFCLGFIICVACVAILSTSLRKASRFRDSSTAGSSSFRNYGNNSALSTSAPVANSKHRLKNAKVVKVVVLVSTIFIVCNVPVIIFFTLKAFLPGFEPGGKLQNWDALVVTLAQMSALLNVILNIFIYISFNTRYRSIFFAMFGKIEKTNEK